jgi:outer membrane protein insertion porin family
LTFLVLASLVSLGEPFTEVEVRGNVLVPTETILHHLGTPDSETLPAAFQRLFDTGLFEDVRFETETTPSGLRLIVLVDEKPLLRSVRFAGDTTREAELRAAVALERRLNRPFGNAEARELAKAAELVLGPSYRVEPRLQNATEVQVDLELEVSRREAPRIEKITFVGNERLTEGALRDVMRLKASGAFSWATRNDRFGPALLDDDLARLREHLRSRGYAAGSVGPARVEALPDGKVGITIEIREGEVFHFGLIALEPGPLLKVEEVRDWLPPPESRFDGVAVDRASERLSVHYRNRGYPTVHVNRDERLRSSERLVDVALRVAEGVLYSVGRIRFEGNERHRDEELRVLLDLVEGETFDESALESGVRTLMSLGSFRDVTTEIDVATTPGEADILYRVVEMKPFEYLVGGGLNGVQGGSGTGQFITRSVFGRAERIDLELDLGNRFQNFAASYREPTIFSRRVFFDASFRRADLRYPDETSEDTTDLAFRAGGPWGATWRVLSGFRLSDFTLRSSLEGDVPFLTPFLGERFRTYRTSLALAIEGRDRPVFTSRGLAADAAYEWVEGDVSLQRLRARASLYVPLDRGRRHLLTFSGQAEALRPYGSTAETGIPRFERLFLGSENDLRGFSIRGVGPREGDVVVGGDRLIQGSFEYVLGLGSRLRLVGFFDLGSVYATDFEGLDLPGLRYDAGAEAQILAPIVSVPVRIGYGSNLDPVEGESKGRFFVSLAFRF